MALFSAITTRLERRVRVFTRISDFSSFFPIAIGSIKIFARIFHSNSCRDKRDFRIEARNCATINYIIRGERLSERKRDANLRLQKIGEHTSRPIHPDVFSPPCARRCNIFRSSVCVYSFARTFSVIISCPLRQRCVTVNEM